MVAELLAQTNLPVQSIFALQRWADDNAALIAPFWENFNPVTEAELRKISVLMTPNSVVAIAPLPEVPPDPVLAEHDLCLYLDGIQDPGNMGTILRVADWFGLPAVFCAPDCVDVFSPKVVQASMGAIFRIKTTEITLSDLLDTVPNLPVMGAVLGGTDVFQAEWPKNGLLVIGNEGKGVSMATQHLLTHLLTIPRHPAGGAESLNAAVATGILVAALRR